MAWIVITILLVLTSLLAFLLSKFFKGKKDIDGTSLDWLCKIFKITSASLLGLSLLVTICNCVYTQDPGQASVLVSFTGEVQSINYETGLHMKAPWTNRVEYDTRNNTLAYVGTNGNVDNYTGGDVSGPQITFQDANGVSGNIDLNIRYSIRGNAVGNIYNEYKTQQEFVNAVLAPSVRATTREILSKYDTAKVYNSRDEIKGTLTEALQSTWDNVGVDVEDIYLQEVRYPSTVVDAFASAQSAKALVERAKAEQETAKVEAETNKIKAQALDNRILTEKMIDAIRNSNGNTFVIGDEMVSIGVK